MNEEVTRRRLLQFIGGGAGAVAFSSLFKSGEALFVPAAKAGIFGDFTPVRLPYPLPIYTEKESWLATSIGGVGVIKNPNDAVNWDQVLLGGSKKPSKRGRTDGAESGRSRQVRSGLAHSV